jgi:hypothetical protein
MPNRKTIGNYTRAKLDEIIRRLGDITSVVAGTGLSGGGSEGAVTLNVDAAQTQITSVGALDGGSISSGFGAIDNGTSNITTGGKVVIDVDGSAINAAGSITLGAGNDASIYFEGTDLAIDGPSGAGVVIAAAGSEIAVFKAAGLDVASGKDYFIDETSVLNATTLGSTVLVSSLTAVGPLSTLLVTGKFTMWGGCALMLRKKTVNYALGIDNVIIASRSTTQTLPASHSIGDTYTVKRYDDGTSNGAITVATADSDTIDGESSYSIDLNKDSVTVVSDGTNWFIISEVLND